VQRGNAGVRQTAMTIEGETLEQVQQKSLSSKLISGEYGLAITYWCFYFAGAVVFLLLGSGAVDKEDWLLFLGLIAVQLAYTVILLIGIRAAYKGPQLWKVMSRTSSVFMIINILIGISALGFIYR
jgi:hypothetical protein